MHTKEEETFFDKGNILISGDTKYTQPMQQHNTKMAVRMHIAKKKKKKSPATLFQP
jgi:hypothetical protein